MSSLYFITTPLLLLTRMFDSGLRKGGHPRSSTATNSTNFQHGVTVWKRSEIAGQQHDTESELFVNVCLTCLTSGRSQFWILSCHSMVLVTPFADWTIRCCCKKKASLSHEILPPKRPCSVMGAISFISRKMLQ